VGQFVVEFREPLTHHGDVGFGGSLKMMGQQCRSESLFYYFRIEDLQKQPTRIRLHRSYSDVDRLTGFFGISGVKDALFG
jgi:hypothetical protein